MGAPSQPFGQSGRAQSLPGAASDAYIHTTVVSLTDSCGKAEMLQAVLPLVDNHCSCLHMLQQEQLCLVLQTNAYHGLSRSDWHLLT